MKQTATASTPRLRRILAFSRASVFVQRNCRIEPSVQSMRSSTVSRSRRLNIGPDHVLVGVPEVFLVGAPDLDDVAVALGADHRGGWQPARNQRVCGNGGAVGEEGHVFEQDLRLIQPPHRTDQGVFGRRCRLRDPEGARVLVENTDIGERAADIDRYPELRHGVLPPLCPLLSPRRRRSAVILPLPRVTPQQTPGWREGRAPAARWSARRVSPPRAAPA